MNVSISPNEVFGQWRASANAERVEDATAAAAHALIRARRSVRHYEERQPPQAALERVLPALPMPPLLTIGSPGVSC